MASSQPVETVVASAPAAQKPSAFEAFFSSPTQSAFSQVDAGIVDQSGVVEELEAHLNTPSQSSEGVCTTEYATQTWDIYGRLATSTRRFLPHSTLRAVLAQICPQDNAVRSNRKNRLTVSLREGRKYHDRLQYVLRDLHFSPHGLELCDMELALRRITRYGYMQGMEELYDQTIKRFPDLTTEKDGLLALRLTAMIKWAKRSIIVPTQAAPHLLAKDPNAQSPRAQLLEEQGDFMLQSLWAILHEYTSNAVKPTQDTLALLVEAINLSRELYSEPQSARRLDQMLEHLLKEAYGIDLPYIAAKANMVEAIGADLRGLEQPAINVLIQWYGRRKEIWKMIAASESFEPNIGSTSWLRAPDAAVSAEVEAAAAIAEEAAAELQAEQEDDVDDVGPTLSDAEAAYMAESAEYDIFGRPKKPSVIGTMIHDAMHPSSEITDDMFEPRVDTQNPEYRTYEDFADAPPVPFGKEIAASVEAFAATTSIGKLAHGKTPHTYGKIDTSTYLRMFDKVKSESDFAAMLHLTKTYVDAASRDQAVWIRAVLTEQRRYAASQALLQDEAVLSQAEAYREARDQHVRAKHRMPRLRQRWVEEQMKLGQEEIGDLAAVTARAEEMFPIPPKPHRILIPRPRKDWIPDLKPPKVTFSRAPFNFPYDLALAFHELDIKARKEMSDLKGRVLQTANKLLADAVERVRQEHVVLSGREPTQYFMRRRAYELTMSERLPEEVDATAPFAHVFSNFFAPAAARGKFDPASYLYHLNCMHNELKEFYERQMKYRQLTLEKRLRRLENRAYHQASKQAGREREEAPHLAAGGLEDPVGTERWAESRGE